MVEKIIALNSFGAPRSSYEQFMTSLSHHEPDGNLFSAAGIWLTASKINHSCIGNCHRSFIGDIAAETELLFHYHSPNPMEIYQDVQKGLRTWGFVCECGWCKDRKNTTRMTLKQRQEFSKQLTQETKDPGTIAIQKASRLLKGLERTYHGKAAKKVRLELALAYAAMSSSYQRSHSVPMCQHDPQSS
jgi:hypothetical protein